MKTEARIEDYLQQVAHDFNAMFDPDGEKQRMITGLNSKVLTLSEEEQIEFRQYMKEGRKSSENRAEFNGIVEDPEQYLIKKAISDRGYYVGMLTALYWVLDKNEWEL
ncbi:MAG TPA: hypothetical protein G4O18_06680 [Dehalococcoidia bacterium]|nr:hypothetical protein [Dehalococcoidia bacterium]